MKIMIKPLEGYEKQYYILSDGRIWSRKRTVKHFRGGYRTIGGKFLKWHVDNRGYYVVCLSKDGMRQPASIHRLIGQHFVPNSENKCCINHKDGNKLNNSLNNLEWVTYQENAIHASIAGLAVRGELNGSSKLTEDQVIELRTSHISKGVLKRKPWKKYNISMGQYYCITSKKSWSYLNNV